MKILALTLFLLVAFVVNAQKPFGPSASHSDNNRFYIELMGGGIIPSMRFEGTAFDSDQSQRFFGQTEGLGFRIQSSKMFSYSALISYREQGVSLSNNNTTLLTANYLNLFVPLEVDIRLVKSIKKESPMVVGFIGPYAAYFLKGAVESGNEEYAIARNEINQWDAGLEGGIGIRIPTYSLQGHSDINLRVSYYYGLLNSFPADNLDYSTEKMNLLLLSSSGSRFNRGIRISIIYAMSFGGKAPDSFVAGGNGKSTYKRFINLHK